MMLAATVGFVVSFVVHKTVQLRRYCRAVFYFEMTMLEKWPPYFV